MIIIGNRQVSIKWTIISLTSFVLIWEVVVWLWQLPPYILPSPLAVPRAMADMAGLLWQHGLVTLTEGLSGFALAIIVGVGLAIAMDELKIIYFLLYPLVVISQTVPIIALAPLLIIWFGYGVLPKIMVVGLVCFFPVLISFYQGLQAADTQMIGYLRTLGASRRAIFRLVKLPGAIGQFFAGLKIAAAYSIMGAVIGEWLGAQQGLGMMMLRAAHSFAIDRVFAVIIVIVALSMAVFYLIWYLERVCIPWQYLKQSEGGKENDT